MRIECDGQTCIEGVSTHDLLGVILMFLRLVAQDGLFESVQGYCVNLNLILSRTVNLKSKSADMNPL